MQTLSYIREKYTDDITMHTRYIIIQYIPPYTFLVKWNLFFCI